MQRRFHSLKPGRLFRDWGLLAATGLSFFITAHLVGAFDRLAAWPDAQVRALVGTGVLTLAALLPLSLVLFYRHATARKAKEGRDGEHAYQSLFENALEGLYQSTLDGRFTNVNPALVRMLGYERRAEVLALDVTRDVYAAPEARTRLLASLEAQGTVYGLEAVLRKKDGATIVVREHARSLFDEAGRRVGLEGLLIDVTEQHRSHAALQAQRDFALQVMNTMGQGLVITDATFHIEYVNPALARMLGEELDGLTGKPVRCLVMPADLGKLNVALAARAQGHAGTYEIRLQRTDGSLLDVLVNAVPRPMGGAIAVVTDLTERKQFEHQLVEALTAAEETVRRRTAFMATMSHEVRTPLTGIIGFASVLADELGPEQGEMAQIIKRSGERLLDTLNSVLDLARVEAGILHVTLEPVDVVAEVLDAARLFMPIAAQKGLLLRVQKPPCSVRASLNAVYLHRILCNLLSNAIKFTEAGGITVDVELIDDEVCIRVRDTGLGIDETFLPHLFQDFTQETPEPTQAHEGSGLGLAISQRLVECMNGRIEVASHKGQGSVFLVAFPCSAQPRHEPAAPEAALGPTLVT